jgi:SAM-dependent methyltransferase
MASMSTPSALTPPPSTTGFVDGLPAPSRHAVSLVWPLPALLGWTIGWLAWASLRALGVPSPIACGIVVALVGALALRASTPWRRACVAAGFPLSLVALGLGPALPAWSWLMALALLLLAYPLRAWRDAPLFPTPPGALQGLALAAPLGPEARVLDAGCGLGAGLVELRREYPRARLAGVEWSWPLRFACAWRCRDACIARADLWAHSWAGYDLVYLFQRPESLGRALDKARREMRPGSWLVSLEFAAADVPADRRLAGVAGRPVWLYQLPAETP